MLLEDLKRYEARAFLALGLLGALLWLGNLARQRPRRVEPGRVMDGGVDRMWVIVKGRTETGYVGVLDSDPGRAENLELKEGDSVHFGPEHVTAIEYPPRPYVVAKYGESFFGQPSRGA